MNLATAITTAPRERPTLEWSLQSLLRSGFTHLHVYNDTKNNAWQNWLRAASGLLTRDPTADWYMICQDDAIYCAGLRKYLEGLEGKRSDLAFASPWCPGPYRADRDGWGPRNLGWKMCGAVCLVFPRDSLEAAMTEVVEILKGKLSCYGRKIVPTRQIDAKLGLWAKETERRVLFHTPSLVQHIGHDNSSMGRPVGHGDTLIAPDFPGVETTPEEAMAEHG